MLPYFDLAVVFCRASRIPCTGVPSTLLESMAVMIFSVSLEGKLSAVYSLGSHLLVHQNLRLLGSEQIRLLLAVGKRM
jgi:hypothetical protein